MHQVVIAVLGGVAYIEVAPPDIEVVIVDLDNDPSVNLEFIRSHALKANQVQTKQSNTPEIDKIPVEIEKTYHNQIT